MTVREYVGARYIPLIMGEWDNTVTYEPLSVVMYQGDSFTSRQYVPIGVEITNETYWAPSGNFNAQLEAYRQEVAGYSERISETETLVADLDAQMGEGFSSENTVSDAISDIEQTAEDAETAVSGVDAKFGTGFSSENTVRDEITAINAELDEITSEAVKQIKVIACEFSDALNVFYKLFRWRKDQYDITITPSWDIPNSSVETWVKMNSPIFAFNGASGHMLLSRGVVLGESDEVASEHPYIFAIDADNECTMIKNLDESMTASEVKALGYVTAFRSWGPVIINGVKFNWQTEINPVLNIRIYNEKHARSVLGYDDDYFYLLQIEGMVPYSEGLTYDEMYLLCVQLNIPNAFNMDGGGSVQSWVSHPAQNLVYQNKRTSKDNPQESRLVTMFSLVDRS